MPPGVRCARAIVAALARCTPGWRSVDWRQEWDAEIDYRAHRLAAAGRFGGVAQIALVLRCAGAAPHVLWLWCHEWSLDMVLHDARYAVRTLGRRPAFTITAVLTLALAIGANTAIFSLVDRLLLRPLPFAEQDRLVAIWKDRVVSKRTFDELRRSPAEVFDRLSAYSNWTFTLTGRGDAVRLEGVGSSAGFFDVLGVRPALGRTFAEGEDGAGKADVAVISTRLWAERFGGDPGVVGQLMQLGNDTVTIIGVMPPSFEFPRRTTDVWRPLPFDPADERDYIAGYLSLMGRLNEGQSVEQGTAFLRAFASRLAAADPSLPRDFAGHLTAEPLRNAIVGDTRKGLLLLFGAVGCVLLVAAVNLANLLLARAASRRREMAVRGALGASRLRLVRQLIVESLVLAALGAAAGLGVAYWGIRLMVASLPETMPGLSQAALDWRVLTFMVGLACLTALLFGVAPAVQLSRSTLRSAMDEDARSIGSAGRARGRQVLIVAEVALAVMLVSAAGLLVKSLWRLTQVDPGFAPDRLLTLRLSQNAPNDEAIAPFQQQLLERIGALPGVVQAGAIHLLPMSPGNWDPDVRVEGRATEPDRLPAINWRAVSAGYFGAMEIPLIRGRVFTNADDGRAERVALINQTMAERLFPGEDPIGQRISTFFEGEDGWARIIGIVGDVRQHGLSARQRPEMYRPLAQHPLPSVSLVIRTSGSPDTLASAVRAEISTLDPDTPVWDVRPMVAVVRASIAQREFFALLIASFAGAALVLAAIGIFGVMAYDVSQQSHDIGVRLALGAEPSRLKRDVLARALRLTLTGLVLGVPAALTSGRLLGAFLFDVRHTDPGTFAAVAGLLALVGIVASYVPARRAAGMDPIEALRAE